MRRIVASLIAVLMLGMAVAQEAEVIDAIYYRDLVASDLNGIALESCPQRIAERDVEHAEFTLETACFSYQGPQFLAKAETEIMELMLDGYEWDGPWQINDLGTIWRYMITVYGDVFAIALTADGEMETLGIIDLFVFPEE